MKLFKTAILATLLAASSNSWANESAPAAGSGPNPFSDCGIGAALFSDVSWAAVSSNVIWDLGSTAVTSATASQETCSGNKLAAAVFINDTYETLVEETAKGQGEHLVTLMNILECKEANQKVIISDVRSSMGAFIGSPSYDLMTHVEKASSYYDVVNSAIANKCSA